MLDEVTRQAPVGILLDSGELVDSGDKRRFRWKYTHIFLSGYSRDYEARVAELNELLEKGWEPFAASNTGRTSNSSGTVCVHLRALTLADK